MQPTPSLNASQAKYPSKRFITFLFFIATLVFLAGFLFGRFTVVNAHGSGDASSLTAITTTTENPRSPSASWNLALVNYAQPLPLNFEPKLQTIRDGYRFDTRAAKALIDMLKDAEQEGLSPMICSAYRSVEKQTTLYQNKVQQFIKQGLTKDLAAQKAATIVAYPGTSEHNLGLAVDIVAKSNQLLDEKQATTPEGIWLRQNCHRYGFILRYPPEKQSLTGIIYEPWHFRYVGVEAATAIMQQGICLEEYLQATI